MTTNQLLDIADTLLNADKITIATELQKAYFEGKWDGIDGLSNRIETNILKELQEIK